jgi:hypothetical protein
MKKVWIKKFNSFKKAQQADIEYYLKMTPEERLDAMQYLREMYPKFKGKAKHECATGLRRVIKIIQQT